MKRQVLTILLTVLPLLAWSEVTLNDFTYNSGGFYEISSAEDMVKLSQFVNPADPSNFDDWGHASTTRNKIFKVVVPVLDFAGITDFMPIGMSISGERNRAIDFRGTFDGQGVVIKNLTIHPSDELSAGLFGYVSGVIRNITLDASCTITGNEQVGGIVGCLSDGGNVSGCHNFAMISGTKGVGGIVGATNIEAKIEHCTNGGEIFGFKNVGGIVGGANRSKSLEGLVAFYPISDCSNQGSVIGYDAVAGIVGHLSASLRNCSNSGAITMPEEAAEGYSGYFSSLGGIVGSSWGNVENCTNEGDVISKRRYAYCIGGISGSAGKGLISGCVVKSCTISGRKQVGAIAWFSDAALSENVYLSEVVVILNGHTYDGEMERGVGNEEEMHDVTMMNVNGTTYYNGAVLDTRRIDIPEPDVTLDDFHFNGSYYEIASAADMVKLSKYVNAGNGCNGLTFQVTASSLDFSGIDDFEPIGFYKSNTEESPFYGTFNGQNVPVNNLVINNDELPYVGLFGYVKGTVRNVVMGETCRISSNKTCGGIVGRLGRGLVSHCTNHAPVTSEQGSCGGIVGESEGSIEHSTNYGSITGETSGGIVDFFYGDPGDYDYYIATVKQCYNYGTVKATGYTVGGIAGVSTAADAISCENYGDVEGTESSAAGIVGTANHSVVNQCKNAGAINAASSGGIVGNSYFSNMLSSSNEGSIFGTYGAGGILGGTANYESEFTWRSLAQTKILGCSNTGTISSQRYAGGIAGDVGVMTYDGPTPGYYVNNATISDCTHAGDVSVVNPDGDHAAGGILGHALYANTITDCLVLSGTISDTGTSHPFAGAILGMRTSNYGQPEVITLARNFYYQNVIVIVADKTFDGNTPRGVCFNSMRPSDVYANSGAVLRADDYDLITPIPSSTIDADRYTLDGKRITTSQRGLNIVKMSNGKVRKVLRK